MKFDESTHRPRLAMVTCIQNEARFLAANLHYHYAVGVQRAYVFLDQCTDGSDRIAASFPWVRAIRITPEDAARFEFFPDLQVACMMQALSYAREEGFQWLMMIDPDEFAVAFNRNGLFATSQPPIARADLLTLLARTSADTEQVVLSSWETLPRDLDPQAPFWEQTYFMHKQSYRRAILDPTDGIIKNRRGNLGHRHGKSLIRTDCDVQPLSPHRWTRNQGVRYPELPGATALKTEHRGSLLHFLLVDWQQWLEKYAKFSNQPKNCREGGSVAFPKQCWREAAGEMTREDAREYFRKWVTFTPSKLKWLVIRGIAQHTSIVEQVLSESGVLQNGEASIPCSQVIPPIRSWDLPDSYWTDDPNCGVVHERDGTVRYQVARLRGQRVRSFHPVEYDGRIRYRRAAPVLEIQLDLPPRDYKMTVDIPRATAAVLTIDINGRRLQTVPLLPHQEEVTVWLTKEDLGNDQEIWLRLKCKSGWPRPLGKRPSVTITEVSFEPQNRAA